MAVNIRYTPVNSYNYGSYFGGIIWVLIKWMWPETEETIGRSVHDITETIVRSDREITETISRSYRDFTETNSRSDLDFTEPLGRSDRDFAVSRADRFCEIMEMIGRSDREVMESEPFLSLRSFIDLGPFPWVLIEFVCRLIKCTQRPIPHVSI